MAIGLGYGLYEEIQIKDGQVLNPNFLEYKIPTALDIPAIYRMIVENYDENGPFGAKGIGNSSVVNMAPAIANAVFTLTGVRLRELPMLPEKILNLKEAPEKN
jgi:CO/xanthine dehydrogenase Mo-binding subunit